MERGWRGGGVGRRQRDRREEGGRGRKNGTRGGGGWDGYGEVKMWWCHSKG